MSTEIGNLLAAVRSASGLTQRIIAERISGNQTRISRIEAGAGDPADTDAYLAAIGTPEAENLRMRLKLQWNNLPRPSLRHRDLESLILVEEGLTRVRDFLVDDQIPKVLAGQAQLLERRLEEAGQYLLSLDHEVVYVGEIGVGKTTAACRQSGLVLDETTASDLKGMLLDTGGGRTTLCDVKVESGEHFSIKVAPVSDEEIYKLVGEICQGLYEKISGQPSPTAAEFKPAEEVERALRNMAGLLRPARTRRGVEAAPDPAIELAKKFQSLETFTAEFAAKLSLWRRGGRTIEFDGVDEQEGRQWLRSTFTAINNGRHSDFSLPERVTVTVPFALFPESRLSIAVTDTRGVDGSAIRPDILDHLKNPRAITLLCSKWGSAPDPSTQALLTHINETDADPDLLERVAVIALARHGDAVSMRHDSGDAAEDIEEGYDIKLGQVDDALQKIKLAGINAFAFDASADDPLQLTNFVLERISAVRGAQADAAKATISAIDQMIENQEQATALAALDAVSGNLSRFAERHRKLGKLQRPVYDRLLAAVMSLHARTVWASSRRNGRFWNFNVYQYLGDGAAAEAKSGSSKIIAGLTSIIESDLDNDEFSSVHGYLQQVLANAAQWDADFVNAARHHAIAIYSTPLRKAQELWDECEENYGSGRGQYREGVADKLRTWFESRDDLRTELERRIARAWRTCLITPLKKAAGAVGES